MTMTNPALLWAQLTRTALLGTRQSTEPLPDLLAVGSAAGANEREKQALLTAGALSLMRKAGFEPPLGATSNVENAPAEFPNQLVLGVNGSAHLRLLLSGQHSSLLADYLRDMAQHARRVPHSLLVPLLEFARTRPDLHQVVGPVLGSRGTWVAQQNPEWQPLLAAVPTAPDDSVWETGTLRQRIIYLENLRQREPQRGREQLATSLPTEPAKHQAPLLQTLAINLSREDAPLLEQYLGSKSKEVRQAVLPLLARIPDHELIERLWGRASLLLTLKSNLLGKKIVVTLPEVWDKTWLADGIEQKDDLFRGEKATWLGQLLALLPPTRWTTHWQLPPAKILDLAGSSDWAELLLTAWRQALLLHPSPEWTMAYLHYQLRQAKTPPLTGVQAAALLSTSQVSAVLLEYLPRQPRLSPLAAPWENLLLTLPGPWPSALTSQALSVMENTITSRGDAQQYILNYRLTHLLLHMQTAISPAQVALCTTSLTALRDVDSALTRSVDQLLATLHFRQALASSLTEPSSPDTHANVYSF